MSCSSQPFSPSCSTEHFPSAWAPLLSYNETLCVQSLSYRPSMRDFPPLLSISPCLTAVPARCQIHPITTWMSSYGGWFSSPPFPGGQQDSDDALQKYSLIGNIGLWISSRCFWKVGMRRPARLLSSIRPCKKTVCVHPFGLNLGLLFYASPFVPRPRSCVGTHMAPLQFSALCFISRYWVR